MAEWSKEVRRILKRVLVVDDEPRIVGNILAVLEAAGLHVCAASSGEKALERLALEPDYDLLLTDAMMPGMDGFELLRAVREQPAFASLPVLITVAYPENLPPGLAAIEAYQKGCAETLTAESGVPTGVLIKPFHPAILVQTVNAMLHGT